MLLKSAWVQPSPGPREGCDEFHDFAGSVVVHAVGGWIGLVAVLLAVLEQRAGLGFGSCDVYASVVGGIRLGEPGADLAVQRCISPTKSCKNATVLKRT